MKFLIYRSFLIPLMLFTLIWYDGVGGKLKRKMSLSSGVKVKRETDESRNESENHGKGLTSKISPRLKFLPFKLPGNYNKLQIPSSGYVLALENEDVIDSSLFTIAADYLSHPITVTFRISYVNDVDEVNEEISFTATLILQWTDQVISSYARKTYNIVESDETLRATTRSLFKTLDSEFLNMIWKPDIYIENIVKVQHPEVMSPPVAVRVNDVTGQITYVSRIRVKMECEMDLHYYPADTQNCEVVLRSNSYSKDELKLDWADPYGAFLDDCYGPNYDYKIQDANSHDMLEGYFGKETREFSTLNFTIVARRKLSYHIVQTFLPSVFFIIITWLCFLVPSRMVEARIGISMTTLLTLTAMFASVRESTPSVSYVRAIDIWMLSCIFFVFLTLLEFTVLVWLRYKDQDEYVIRKDASRNSLQDKKGGTIELTRLNEEQSAKINRRHLKWNRRRETSERKIIVAEFIDKYAFLIFSVIFVVFCITYWSWLLIGSKYFSWEVDEAFNCAEQQRDEGDEML